jgi:hypothetical protein
MSGLHQSAKTKVVVVAFTLMSRLVWEIHQLLRMSVLPVSAAVIVTWKKYLDSLCWIIIGESQYWCINIFMDVSQPGRNLNYVFFGFSIYFTSMLMIAVAER